MPFNLAPAGFSPGMHTSATAIQCPSVPYGFVAPFNGTPLADCPSISLNLHNESRITWPKEKQKKKRIFYGLSREDQGNYIFPEPNAIELDDDQILVGSSLSLGEPRWVRWSKGQSIPADAVYAGLDSERMAILVSRFRHGENLLPAGLIPMKDVAYATFEGEVIQSETCEVLCCYRPTWVAASNGHVPTGAIHGGRTIEGETLYIARFEHEGCVLVGKLLATDAKCHVPFNGQEVSQADYEVLVAPKPTPGPYMESSYISRII